MDRSAFEQIVDNALRRLPRRFKNKIKNISIEIEDAPSQALLADMGIESGTLFGLYQGVPLTEREWNFGNVLPDRIVIYQRPIEAAATSPDEIEEIITDTVMHEIGHYFGFGDQELYEMEDEKLEKRDGAKLRGWEDGKDKKER
jgi:predicted Zn-dependent protease with MMP-like domain